MTTQRKLVAGNWKMNLLAREGVELARATAQAAAEHEERVDVAVAIPATLIARVAEAVAGSPLDLYGQNVAHRASGAFTGEVSPAMLQDAGATGALIGHSERRHVFGESDELIAERTRCALEHQLPIVLCVGETLEERERGETLNVVTRQLATALDGVTPELLTVAYEPVWAIGTGRTASPEQAREVHAGIRTWLRERFGATGDTLRILYGGSVTAENAATLMAQPDIDGVLVGGASLKADAFSAIIAAAATL